MTHRTLRLIALGCATAVVLAVYVVNAFAQTVPDPGAIVGALCSDAARPYEIAIVGLLITSNLVSLLQKRLASAPPWVQAIAHFIGANWPQVVRVLFKTAPVLLIAVILAATLSACASWTSSGKAWDTNQIAYFEIEAALVGNNVAATVEATPGLSIQQKGLVKAGGQALAASVQAQVAVLQNNGSTQAQILAAGLGGLIPAMNTLGSILETAGATAGAASPDAIALTAGIAEIEQLPALIAIVAELDTGYEPTASDMDAAKAALVAAAGRL